MSDTLTVKKHITIAIRYMTYAMNNVNEHPLKSYQSFLWVVSKHIKQARKQLVVDGKKSTITLKESTSETTNDYMVRVIDHLNQSLRESSTDNYIDVMLAECQSIIGILEVRAKGLKK